MTFQVLDPREATERNVQIHLLELPDARIPLRCFDRHPDGQASSNASKGFAVAPIDRNV